MHVGRASIRNWVVGWATRREKHEFRRPERRSSDPWVEIGAKSSRGDEEEEDLVSLESGNKEWLLFGQIKRGLRGGSI